ncbi:type III secretion system inner membrane ring subunit SctD [Pseudomonas sp. CFBP 13711]|uniref:type III secretion system inner membrane ring subunit SctD n=1 Tax=unclassified Pseudomonas TaxID=196821 RepID=UPI00177B79F3|nr:MULTISPECIES: type III secretion system inner membrane ring subunit SctD [unclassified Pseudomonas]MBD8709847.1 type III secretion system inner membrane ring subunit SctD [Pseudomonas sp. CFBP 13711]MBD8715119.1 type III secretion system inner membrane ring subunit SctD [Pseudomonas sp. CFBP 13715]
MFELRVLTGLHQGAALPLVGEQWGIGADADQDLALHDPGVEQLHCRLQRQGEGWRLNAADGSIADEEGHLHASTLLTPNTAFVLGSVWLCVSPAQDPWPSLPAVIPQAKSEQTSQAEAPASAPLEKVESRSRFFNRTTGVVIGVLLGIAGSAWSLSRSAAPSSDAMAISTPAQQLAKQEPVRPSTTKGKTTDQPASKRIRLTSVDDVKRQLNTMLSERLLSEVSVEQTPDGLALSGNLKPESQLVYQRMLQRFRDRYDTPVALIDNVAAGTSGLPFTIVQIMSGPHAHLVTADGRRLYVGDELAGLRLTRIDDNRIQFDGDRHYEVSW